MSDCAMNAEHLEEASTVLLDIRNNMRELDLRECRASIITGSAAVSEALKALTVAYNARSRATSDWLTRTSLGLAEAAKSNEESDESDARIFGEIHPKL